MITKNEIILLFNRMLEERWSYEWGAAKEGCVDCSGAFVYAYKQEGLSVYHGSNRMARVEVEELLPVSQARPGMIAFKKREPGEEGYNLPDEYLPSGSHYNGDLADYYHVGLVDEDPAYVLNAQSTKTGFVRSKITENWDAVGYGKQIDYNGEDAGVVDPPVIVPEIQRATVISANKGPVKMRSKPSTDNRLYENVPYGTVVSVLEYGAEWSKIVFNGKEGYMMSSFLSFEEGAGENIDKDSYDEIESARNIATVTSSNGGPVKMRAEPSETCRLYWKIPSGSQVKVLDDSSDPGWWKISDGVHTGYMMEEFLSRG